MEGCPWAVTGDPSPFTVAPVAPRSRFLCWGHSLGFGASTAQSQQASVRLRALRKALSLRS